MKKDLIIFTDCGDTLVDESTQVFHENGDVLKADLFPGAREFLEAAYAAGYPIVLVADGRTASFRNIFRELGLSHIFTEWIISEELGVEKPDPLMFTTAMEKMGLTTQDTHRIVMLGNNLKRDIVGANKLGICSILHSQTPRYDMIATCADELPDYVVETPTELFPLLEQLNRQIQNKRILQWTY